MYVHSTLDHPRETFHALKFLVGVLQGTSPAHTLKDDFLLNWPLAIHMAVSITRTFVSALENPVIIVGSENKEDQIREFLRWAGSIRDPDELQQANWSACLQMLDLVSSGAR
jgi:hypothetical protein